jgi:GTP cyclohydrolase IB
MNMQALPDIQDSVDDRGIALDEVGVANVRQPITWRDGSLVQSSVGLIDVTVALPADRKGTHMSRMVELAGEHLSDFDPRDLPTISKAFAVRCQAESVQLRLAMPIATQVAAPVSGIVGWQAHDVEIRAVRDGDHCEVGLQVTTDVTSLCPCSKAISDYGAHNQRSRVTLTVTGDGDSPYPLPVTKVVELLRSVGSAPVYPVVKRPDERFLTMQAFDNPAFVEDIARDVSAACRAMDLPHSVLVVNLESIHGHDAVARLRWAPNDSTGR